MIRDAAHRRMIEHRTHTPCHVYIDECSDVIANDRNIEDIVFRCRSQLISLTLAHQVLTRISPFVRSALAGCAIKLVNAVDFDASEVASLLRCSPEEVQQPRGVFYAAVRGMSPRTPVHVKHIAANEETNALIDYQETTDLEMQAFQQYMWKQYSYTPKTQSPPPPPPPRDEPKEQPRGRQERQNEQGKPRQQPHREQPHREPHGQRQGGHKPHDAKQGAKPGGQQQKSGSKPHVHKNDKDDWG